MANVKLLSDSRWKGREKLGRIEKKREKRREILVLFVFYIELADYKYHCDKHFMCYHLYGLS